MSHRLIGIVVACGFLVGCEKAKLREDPSVETHEIATEKYYPFFRDLTDARGRKVEAEVLGRDLHNVTFVRWSDKRRYTVPIASLSQADQTYLLSLPAAPPRSEDFFGMGPIEERNSTKPEDQAGNRGYVGILEGRLAEKEKEIEAALEELRDPDLGSIRRRTLGNRIEKLRAEMVELDREIGEEGGRR